MKKETKKFAELVSAVGSSRKVAKMLNLSKSRINELRNGLGAPKQDYINNLKYCVAVMKYFGGEVENKSVSEVARNSGLSRRQVSRLVAGDFTAGRKTKAKM